MGPNQDGKVDRPYIPDKEFQLRWKFEYKGGSPTPIVVENGTIFFGTKSKDIYALDSLGKLKWKIKLNSSITHSLAISKNILIVAPDSSFVYGIDALNGEIIWKRNFDYNRTSVFGSHVKVHDKNILAPILHEHKVYITTPLQIIALDIKTGETLYQTDKEVFDISLIPLITDDYIYTGSNYRYLYAFNKLNGDFKWQSETTGSNEGKPFLFRDTLYFPAKYSLNKINKNTGEEVGFLTSGRSTKLYNIIDREIYYFAKNGYEWGSSVKAINLASEEEIWYYKTPGKIISNIIMVGNYLYFGDSEGYVSCIEKHTGQELFQVWLRGSIYHPLSYADGNFYIASQGFKGNNTHWIYMVR
ncbi:MAG: PQQ-binding-like beta-propeller repeat protein [Thermonemataceae bacterium]